MFLAIYLTIPQFFPTEFSFFLDDSTDPYKTLKNLEKQKIPSNQILACLLIGFFTEKVFIFAFEAMTSSNNFPVKSVIRSCEIGPCFNLVTAGLLNNIAYPIALIAIGSVIFAGYGILGYFGISLIALGGLTNIVPLYTINMIGALAQNSYKLMIFVKSNENSDKLMNFSWFPKNYRAFLRANTFLTVILAGVAMSGNFITFLNRFELINLKSLQIFGLFIGFAIPNLLIGLLINGGLIISSYIVIFVFIKRFFIFYIYFL